MKLTRKAQARKRKADELVAGMVEKSEISKEPPKKKKKLEPKKATKSFRDKSFFMACEPVDTFEEETFAISDGKSQLEKLLLTVDDDEMDAMIKKKRSQVW